MKVLVASDHGGFTLKKEILEFLHEVNVSFEDLGCDSKDSVDYPDFAAKVAEKISQGEAERGILVCGTGIGMAMIANKFKGVRAAAVSDVYSTRMTREHNDANVICFGERVVGSGVAKDIVKAFLETPFAGGRHERRVGKIKELEKRNFK